MKAVSACLRRNPGEDFEVLAQFCGFIGDERAGDGNGRRFQASGFAVGEQFRQGGDGAAATGRLIHDIEGARARRIVTPGFSFWHNELSFLRHSTATHPPPHRHSATEKGA